MGKMRLTLGGGQGADVKGALGWGEGRGAVCVGHVVEQQGGAQQELAAQEPDQAPDYQTVLLVSAITPHQLHQLKVTFILHI